MLNKVVKYFRECYMADNRDLTLTNFFSDKVEKRFIIEEKEELITGFYPHIPIKTEDAEEISKTLRLYSKEKELLYCSMFIIGKTYDYKNRLRKVCAPLLFFPAQLVYEDDLYYLSIDLSHRRFNYSILSSLREENQSETDLFEVLFQEMPPDKIDFKDITKLSRILKKYFPSLDTEPMHLFPDLYPEKKIKKMLQPSQLEALENFTVIPAAGAGLVKKSTDTLGVLNELSAISRSKNFSLPVQTLLGDKAPQPRIPEIPGKVPSILNTAQQKILQSATRFPFSLVVGPPGTGKSYTIASLAIEQLSKGKTVLIASRTDEAVDVIANKIEKQLSIKNVIIRGGRSNYLRELKKHLQDLLNGINVYGDYNKKMLKKINRNLNRNERIISRLERKFNRRVEREKKAGRFWARHCKHATIFQKIRLKFIAWRNNNLRPPWDIIDELDENLNFNIFSTIEYVQGHYALQVAHALQHHRNELNSFNKAIRSRTGNKQEEYFQETDFNIILQTFPVWLVKLTDIYKVLPLQQDLFDIAIIDEATQCDISTCIPVMQRAKKVVFAGDPNQLRHVSFLSRIRQEVLQKKLELNHLSFDQLNYREKSILDIVSDKIQSQDQVTFLDEHYRSTPAIIRFSNHKFYSNSLRIMTDTPDNPVNEGVKLIKTQGVRDKRGYNKAEADWMLEKIHHIIDRQKDLSTRLSSSIGVLSPFRDQIDYLLNRISKEFTLEQLDKHQILAGTAYSFQGEERDVMLISFVLDNDSHPTAFYHLNKPDVFNVSITRARSLQYVLYSLDTNKLKTDSILREYLESFEKEEKERNEQVNQIKDAFAESVKQRFQQDGFNVWTGYQVAGLNIDLIIQKNGQNFCIDLIGYPGQFQDSFSLERYKMLYRAGLHTFPLAYTHWMSERESCYHAILDAFSKSASS